MPSTVSRSTSARPRCSAWSASRGAASRRSAAGCSACCRRVPSPTARSCTGDGISWGSLRRSFRACAGPELGLIFQEPMTRLNPLLRIEDHFKETLERHEPQLTEREIRQRSLETLGRMGIPPDAVPPVPARVLGRDATADHDRARAGAAAEAAGRRRADDVTGRDRRGADPRDPRRPEAQLRHGPPAHHPQPRDHRRGLRPGRRHVRGQDRRGWAGARRVRRPGASVHAGAPSLDDLAGDDRAALDPGRAAEPDRPARRAATSTRAARTRCASAPGSSRSTSSRDRTGASSAGCTGRKRRSRRAEAAGLEREEIAVADEA